MTAWDKRLLIGPAGAAGDAEARRLGASAVLADAGPSAPPVAEHARRGAAVAVSFDPWPAAGDAPNLPLLTWTLAEENEPMELVLAGVEAGRALLALGADLVIGPSLAPDVWRGPTSGSTVDADLLARASSLFLEGLAASGPRLCVDGYPAVSIAEITGAWRAFPHAFAHGVEALRLAGDAVTPTDAAHSCRQLRAELGFTGLVLARAESAQHVAPLLAAGCDLVQVSLDAAEEAGRRLESAIADGRLEPRRLAASERRVDRFFDVGLAEA